MRSLSVVSIVFVCAFLASSGAQASTIIHELTIEFSGGAPPGGPAPWLTATFDDGGTPGSVDLTLETTNLIGNEFVAEWLFNLDPALDPTNLVFSAPVKTGSFADPTVGTAVNAYNSAFDIQVDFATNNGPSVKFGSGETVAYVITSVDPITALSFNVDSIPNGDPGVYREAAMVDGISGGGSGWVGAVPEPTTLSLLALGGLLAARRRR